MDTIANRIKIALDARKMKQADLVKATGIGKSSISTYISGEYEPKQRNIYKIAKALRVNEAWLMGLDVPMERTTQDSQTDPLEGIDFALADAYRNLSPEAKSDIIKYAEFRKQQEEAEKQKK